MLVSPIGCGAAVNLLGGIAVDYHVSGSQVAWINGMAGALLTAAGAFMAGLIPGHMDAQRSYAIRDWPTRFRSACSAFSQPNVH